MESPLLNNIFNEKLSDRQFEKISKHMYDNYGIKLPVTKKILVEGRLKKRLSATNINSFDKYCEYVFSEHGGYGEIVNFVDALTTNKTDFFREPIHFEFMKQVILPTYIQNKESRPLRIWSSASSTGEESYSIAITIKEFSENLPFYITASDLSTQVLKSAVTAVYPENKVYASQSVLKKYFLQSKDREKPTVRVKKELRQLVSFLQVNLMDDTYPIDKNFDIIFCRNVLIYFDRPTQISVVNKLCQYLKPGGYLFLGHSESINDPSLPLKQIKPTIFKKKD